MVDRLFAGAPLLGILWAFLACVLWEQMAGEGLASLLRLPGMPILFGIVTLFKVIAGLINSGLKGAPFDPATLLRIPMAILYFVCIYGAPLMIVARLVGTAGQRAGTRPPAPSPRGHRRECTWGFSMRFFTSGPK